MPDDSNPFVPITMHPYRVPYVPETVRAAIAGGATITFEPKWPGKPYAECSATWPDGTRIVGALGIEASSALEALERELAPAAAAETMKRLTDERAGRPVDERTQFGAPEEPILPSTFYERAGDMDPNGFLRVLVEEDGDVIVAVCGTGLSDERRVTSTQFCTIGAGGGRSPTVLRALRDLIRAIQLDNLERPIAPAKDS